MPRQKCMGMREGEQCIRKEQWQFVNNLVLLVSSGPCLHGSLSVRETFAQCCFNVGPASQMQAQH